MRALIPLVLISTAATAAAPPAGAPQERLDRAIAGKVAGAPISCISLPRAGSSEIIDETAIIYRQSRSRLVVNRIPGGCPGLTRNRAFATRTPGTRLCRGDIITVFDPRAQIPYGSCALGDFVPYEAPRRAP